MIKAPPNNLRLIDGELVMADGSDVREYLRAWAERVGITPDTPLSMVSRDDLVNAIEAQVKASKYSARCGLLGEIGRIKL